jgi:hypothetical protein
VITGTKHIAVAVGRDPESLPPIAGTFSSESPVTSSLEVQVEVKEIV